MIDLYQIEHDATLKECLDTFLSYASHAIKDKSIPTLQDGLLPSQRRIIFALQDLKAASDKKTVKSSMVSSRATGFYHPVGSVYDVLVNMSQDFKVQTLLTNPEGNWGEPENGVPAAERYTETKLSKFAEQVLLYDLPGKRVSAEKNPHGVVPCSVTYTGLEWEEDFFPARLPLLLLNGSNGIAVGLAQTFQPLSYNSLLKVFKEYLESGNIRYENLRLGYPTECEIVSTQESFIEAIKTGRGTIQTAGRHEFERGQVVFHSIPPHVTYNAVGDAFNDWRFKDKECPFLSFKNETEGNKVRLVFKFKPSHTPKKEEDKLRVVQQLYKILPLATSQTVNMVALKYQYPILYSIEQFLRDWTEERSNTILRLAEKRLSEYKVQLRKVDILLWVKHHLIRVIEILKESETEESIKQKLNEIHSDIEGVEITDSDMTLILAINLRQLSKLSEDEILGRKLKLLNQIKEQEILRDSKESRIHLIIDEVEWFINNRGKLGIRDLSCRFNPELAELLNRKFITPKSLTSHLIPKGEIFDPLLARSSTTRILVQTKKDFFFVIGNKSVRSAPFNLKFVMEGDEVKHATFIKSDKLTFISDQGKLVYLDTDLLTLGNPYHHSKIMELAKVKQNGTKHLNIIPVLQDKSKWIILYFKDRTYKKIPLSDFNTLRGSIVFPSELVYACFVRDEITCKTDFPVNGITTWEIKAMKQSSFKRVKYLPVIKQLGMPTRIDRNTAIFIAEDKKGIYKKVNVQDPNK